MAEVPYRVLVTGSRYWIEESVVFDALDAVAQAWGVPMVVVEGQCPYGGADEFAHEWATLHEHWGVRSERHPAPWRQMGKAAGPLRNSIMVNLGARICLAFPESTSVGTRDCMAKAHRAGIPIWNVSASPQPPFWMVAGREV